MMVRGALVTRSAALIVACGRNTVVPADLPQTPSLRRP